MDVVVAGSQGLIGRALVADLRADGHTVRRLVRREPRAADEARWDPRSGVLDPAVLEGADGVVNLAGAGVGDHRWTEAYKREILVSRTSTTGLLARTLATLPAPPPVWVQASAVGYYGDRGDEVLTEVSPPGDDFLAGVVRAWEASTLPAEDAGVRVAHLRSGIVMTPSGGALGRMLPLLRLGVGGRLGSGRQWWPWITLADEVAAIRHLLVTPVHGPVNGSGPLPATNAAVTRALAGALHRPAVVPVPRFALRLVLGEFASDVLGSQRALPAALEASGFTFAHPTLESAARWVADGVSRPPRPASPRPSSAG